MQPARFPATFERSCLNSRSYPENLLHRSTNTYRTALQSYRLRLDHAERDLFVEDEDDVEVPFRDLQSATPAGVSMHSSSPTTPLD